MKFKIKITKDVIYRSLMCGTKPHDNIVTSCAFAIAYNELVNVSVGGDVVSWSKDGKDILKRQKLTLAQMYFIVKFDQLSKSPMERYDLVGKEFEVEIPDHVIEHYYGDEVEMVQQLANTEIIKYEKEEA